MASSCYGRRLSELLQEQQEPFLLHGGGATGGTEAAPYFSVAQACRRRLLGRPFNCKNSNAVGRSALGRAARRALRRWDLAGCFPCGGARGSFRQLPRAGDIGTAGHCDIVAEFDEDDVDGARGGRQLSPVSVLDVLHYDEEKSSPMLRNWEEDDEESSTSGSSQSPPSGHDLTGAASPRFTFYDADKIRATEVQDKDTKATRTGKPSIEGEQTWERIAVMVELDLSGSAREWRRLPGEEEEASRVGVSIAAMIFEEIRAEAVRDMLYLLA